MAFQWGRVGVDRSPSPRIFLSDDQLEALKKKMALLKRKQNTGFGRLTPMPPQLLQETPEVAQLKVGERTIAIPPLDTPPTCTQTPLTVSASEGVLAVDLIQQCLCGNCPPKMSKFCNMCGKSLQFQCAVEQDATEVKFLKAIVDQ